jgi:hypothetical protein
LVSNTPVFTDNDRSGTGVPEPMTLGAISLFAMGVLSRRRRPVH